MVNRGYKTELKLNNKQRTLCLKHAGASRFAYNWGLERKENVYRMNMLPVPTVEYPNAISLHRELNILKKEVFEWMYGVSKCAPQEALRDLDYAFKKFFKWVEQGGEWRVGHPRFKSRKQGSGSFRLTGHKTVENDRIKLPRIGWVRLKEHGYIPICKPSSITVSERAGRWFVSIMVEEEEKPSHLRNGIVGVDLGIKHLAVCSDGMVFENPKALQRYGRKLRRQQKAVSRKKGSMNRMKAVRELQRTHFRVSNIRQDNLHKTTSWLARNKQTICIEDLDVKNMMKNHRVAKAINDVSFGRFRRQMVYKTSWHGSILVFADRYFPSSKTCSSCGHIRDVLKLSERVFHCPSCGNRIDRDYNASLNLEMVAVSSTETLNACGEESSSPLMG